MIDLFKLLVVSAIFGVGYQITATLLGSKVGRLIWRNQTAESLNLRHLTSLLLGVLVQGLAAGVILVVAPHLLKYLLWIVVAIVIGDWRGSIQTFRDSGKQMALLAGYGLLCFSIMSGFHYGVAQGDNLLWSVYKLTAITPGDSPQGLLQAQYLMYGKSLLDFENFSIFDRPFLGGLITAEALCAVNLMRGMTFNSFTDRQAFAYFALWIWLNSGFALVVVELMRRYATGYKRFVIGVLVMASPCILFNTIGAWPKLFAVYMTCCAAILATNRHWKLAVVFSGLAFYTHGSFLWSHLAMSGTLVLYVLLTPERVAGRLRRAFAISAIAAAFPAIWFFAQHVTGIPSPLRIYYLYGVPVDYGFTHTVDEIAKAYYASTAPGNLAALPFINLLKSLLPFDFMRWLSGFSYTSPPLTWRSFAEQLFYTQINRSLFSLGFIAAFMALVGIRRDVARNWHLSLALAAFFILPLIPGMALYRRDDHFILGIMLFALLPLIVAVARGVERTSRLNLSIFVTLAFGEFALEYWSRYPPLRYKGEFFEYYLWVTLPALALAWLIALRKIAKSDECTQTGDRSITGDASHE